MAETRISLKAGGQDYRNWKEISINRSLTQMSGDFTFSVSNKYPGVNEQWNIYMGSECTVELEGETLLTGYVDEMNVEYNDIAYTVSFKGRDKTSDLIDCCADFDTGMKNELFNLKVIQIIERLCDPFSIDVYTQDSTVLADLSEVKNRFRIDPGEKVHERISELCQQYGVMPITTGLGDLTLSRAGVFYANDKLEGGKNVLSARLIQSDRERYSTYLVKGAKDGGTAFKKTGAVGGVLLDDYIKRYRPLTILAGSSGVDADKCQNRAAWEGRVREGASKKIEVIVHKWTQSNGVPWTINELVSYKDDYIGIDGTFLIAGVRFSLTDTSGELTSLALVHPDTFSLKVREDIRDEPKTAFDENRSLQV